MEVQEIKSIIESLIFVADEPITDRQLLEVLAEAGVTQAELSAAIDSIRSDLNDNAARGLKLAEIAGGYQFRTKESNACWIQKLNVPKPMRLSQPALETLAIVAYRQPLVRSEIEQIRGVDVGAVLKTLLERNLIRIIGRRDEAGQPLIYGTTREFLETFNLKNLHELPTLADIEDLVRQKVETESQTPLIIVKSDDEEPTEIVENDDEDDEDEETEVIKREDEDEEEDEALVRLEKGLKDLRRLERDIFPKPPQAEEQNAADIQAQAALSEGSPAGSPTEEGATGKDAPPKADSAGD